MISIGRLHSATRYNEENKTLKGMAQGKNLMVQGFRLILSEATTIHSNFLSRDEKQLF